jgi:hypothetical protein
LVVDNVLFVDFVADNTGDIVDVNAIVFVDIVCLKMHKYLPKKTTKVFAFT